MRFYIRDSRPIVAEITMPAKKYGVYVSFNAPDELPFEVDKWVAEFADFEDAKLFLQEKILKMCKRIDVPEDGIDITEDVLKHIEEEESCLFG